MKRVVPLLNFDGNCREAMEFYQKCLGGNLTVMPFSEMPGRDFPPETKDRLMHSRLTRGSETILMASDTIPGMPFQQGSNFWISVDCESVQEVDTFFTALGQGGKVLMPAQETFWAHRFGMVTDQFGINWVFNYEKAGVVVV